MTGFRGLSVGSAIMAVIITVCYCFAASAPSEGSILLQKSALVDSSELISSDGSNYAPDRKVDMVHLTLDVTPDFEKQTIRGKVVFNFKPIAKPLDELRLDAVDMSVSDVKSSAPISGYQATDREIIVTFTEPVPPGQQTTLTVSYSAQPIRGLYFRVPASGYDRANSHVYSQGEMIDSRHWFPCYDSPNQKFTSELICHVPEGMTVISNGKQVSATKDPTGGLVAVRWLQDKPHANYLITLAAGYFSKLEDKYRDIPLSFYSLPSDAKEAPLAFAPTKSMIEFYEKATGVDYPWDKYGQVVVHDFLYEGMENTSLTTLSDSILRTADTEQVPSPFLGEFTSEKIIAHELAHQWFGDLLTCKDWSHSWLNEGFASYYSLLYLGSRYGHEELLNELYQDRESVLQHKDESRPIVYRRYHDPHEQFDDRVYARASWVLHMLRCQLGDELFARCVKTYLDRYRFRTVVSSDLNSVVEELSGRSFDRFFDQWIYHPGLPDLAVQYSWDQKTKLARLKVNQQKAEGEQDSSRRKSEDPARQANTFYFPLTVAFKVKGETIEKQVQAKEASEVFYFPLKSAPELVRIDPHLELLAGIHVELPKEMLFAQLADRSDLVGRLTAADELAGHTDHDTISKLKDALQNDPYYGVRMRAAGSLRKIHSDEALVALIASTKQSDSRARNAVVKGIAGFFSPQARDSLLNVLSSEHNPEIIASALRGLGSYHQPAIRSALLKHLSSQSYHNLIADAAIEAVRAQDDPGFIKPLIEEITRRQSAFTTGGLADALDALAFIDRNEKPRDEVRNFIAGFLSDKRQRILMAAIRALGTLEDPSSIAILQTFASALKDTPQREQAEWSISKLRSANKPNDNLSDLRQEVLNLQKANRDMKKEMEDFKKQILAGEIRKDRKARSDKSTQESKKNSDKPKRQPESSAPAANSISSDAADKKTMRNEAIKDSTEDLAKEPTKVP